MSKIPSEVLWDSDVQDWLSEVEDCLWKILPNTDTYEIRHLAQCILENEWEFWGDFAEFSEPSDAVAEELSCWEE